MSYDVQDATKYLETGGLGEVMVLTDMARQIGQPKVQMDTDMAMALCILAGKGMAAEAPKQSGEKL